MSSSVMDWRTPPGPDGYGKHNFNYQAWMALGLQGSGAIPGFISETVVFHGTALTATMLRRVNTEFRQLVDAEIRRFMRVRFNPRLKEWMAACDELNAIENLGPRPSHEDEAARQQYETRRDLAKNNEESHRMWMEMHFDWHTAMTMRKALKQYADQKCTGRGRFPGWVIQPTDVVRMGTTVHAFCAMAGSKTCELHAVTGSSGCICRQTIGGAFAFVPNGKGFLMHCHESCIEAHTVEINPSSARPLQLHVPAGRDRDGPGLQYGSASIRLMKRNHELVENVMADIGVSHPFGREEIRARMLPGAWAVTIQVVHNELLGRRPQINSASAVRVLIRDHPSFAVSEHPHETWKHCPWTLQNLFRIDDHIFKAAELALNETDALEARIARSRRQLVQDHLFAQFDRKLKQIMETEGVADASLAMAENMLPGSAAIVTSCVIDPIVERATKSPREVNVSAQASTARIIESIAIGLGKLPRFDMSFTGMNASPYAHAYITGLCAGKDPNFDRREMSAQLYNEINEQDVSLMHWNAAVCTMHIFDSLNYESIRVVPCPKEEISGFARDYNSGDISTVLFIGKWWFYMGQKRISGPVFAPPVESWFDGKYSGAWTAMQGMGYEPQLLVPPRKKQFSLLARMEPGCEGDRNDGVIQEYCTWFQFNAQHLCGRPETRALGLALLTVDRTRMLIDIVSKNNIDVNDAAVVAVAMQAQEAEEDARERVAAE